MKNYLIDSKKIFFNMVSTFVDFWAIFAEISVGRNFCYFFELLRFCAKFLKDFQLNMYILPESIPKGQIRSVSFQILHIFKSS